ncbi:MAG TPA: PEGA domain-containing protein [Terriglobales bacterium]|nr:PEGA domain-containing protein [Terriglobales bacterium]
MSTKIGRFEILGELAKSDASCVYKASDPESGQTLALKTYNLEAFGEHAESVMQRVLEEAETTKDLSSPNVTLVYGAGEIDGLFCAAMEYIQGNSVATMLARKEGFSIWDLLDISRQVCQGLDHAHSHNVFHCSLEPSKVMVTWDGTVKVLSFGISSTGWVAATATGAPQQVLHYMSPEQVQGEGLDARSNLFSWGAILYEMVTDRKAFDGADADEVRQKISGEMPVSPAIVNPKINPVASDVIMKALAKDPAERYQSGKELAADLEKCREATGKTAKKAEPPKATAVPDAVKGAASAKFATGPKAPSPPAPRAEATAPDTRFSEAAPSLASELETSWTPAKPVEPAPKKASAAAAGFSSGANVAGRAPALDPSAQFITSTMKATVDAITNSNANMSAAVLDEPATEKPKIAVDPMMAENAGPGTKGVSFSEMSELPPLKEIYVAPPPPPKAEEAEAAEPLPSIILRRSEPEKPKIQPREVAQKAIKEIKGVPPQLMMYSIAAAVAFILIVGIYVFWRSMSQNTDEEGRVPAATAPAKSQAPVEQAAPAPTPVQTTQVAPEAVAPEPAPVEEPAPSRNAAAARGRNARKKAAPAPAAAVPGQLVIDSTPQGAQLEIDGRTDPNWVTPYALAGLNPGQHTVTVSKPGFTPETRTVDVISASKASLVVHLASLNATINVSSDPAGAAIFVDGKDTLHVTPSNISLEKGTHTILVRKPGYLDETSSASGQPGQALHFSATLRPLGNVDDIKTVGKFKKLFGGSGAQAGMGKVSVKTSPKGAQIAINRRMLDKGSPVDFLLSPGNYIVDITLTGYKPVQKVITVEQNGSIGIDETLQPE